MNVNELPTPLFARPVGNVPSFTIKEASRLLAKSDDDMSFVYNRLKGAAQRRLIHPRQRPGAGQTSPALFGVDDLAAASLLFAVLDFGINSAEVAQSASQACYAWDEKSNPRPAYIKAPTPIAAALMGAGRADWLFTLADYYCDQTGQRAVIATVSDTEVPHPTTYLPPSFLPCATMTIQLAPLLMPLHRVFKRGRADA